MKVLVTGGAGFIGSHLVTALLGRGDDVWVVDDLSTGQRCNLAHLEGHEQLRLVIADVRDAQVLEPIVEQVDHVLHLAAAVGVKLIVDRPVHTIATNIDASSIIFGLAAKHQTPVLFASTSEVYGKSAKVPFREDDDLHLGATTKSRWAYACSKALDEWLGFAHAQESGLPFTVARLFNTVGPRQVGRYGMVLPTFVEQALSGEPITVFGDGGQTRCFCHVDDVVAVLIKLMESKAAVGKVFNVGSDEEISIADLAQRVKARTNSQSTLKLIPYQVAYGSGFEDMPRRVPNLIRLRELLGRDHLSKSLDDIIDDVARDLSGRE